MCCYSDCIEKPSTKRYEKTYGENRANIASDSLAAQTAALTQHFSIVVLYNMFTSCYVIEDGRSDQIVVRSRTKKDEV
jgi:hypothetical protein